ncbi:MAG: hypothetical protein ABR518_00060 [Actinomycetota bacterium]
MVFASCGGGGGGSTADIEAKLSDKGISNPSCTELSAGESDAKGFRCTGTQQGKDVQIAVSKEGEKLSAVVTAGGQIVDFFVLD